MHRYFTPTGEPSAAQLEALLCLGWEIMIRFIFSQQNKKQHIIMLLTHSGGIGKPS